MHVFFCVSKNVSVSCAYTQGKREQFSGFNRTLDAINNVFRKFSAFHDETGRLNVDGMNIISNDGSNKLDRKSGSAGMPRPISYAVSRDLHSFPTRRSSDLVFFCVSKNVSVSCAYTQGKREQFSGFNRTLDAINNVFRKFSAFHDETGRLNVDGMNIISNDGSNKLNRSRKARVSYKVQRTINASLNAATSTRAVSSNPNFVTRQKIEIIFG